MTAELTPWLRDQVRSGQAILFLGAGATRGATGPKGERPLNGDELRDRISDEFLGGQKKNKPLATVAEFAKYESSLPEVQAFIKSLFWPLAPAPFHELIPQFRWYAIVTTNYDLVVERAYEKSRKRLQDLRPIVRDGDQFSSILRDNTAVPFLKLHGCLTVVNDSTLPLILASEEYAKHKKNRERLFKHFGDWARERPVIFSGYDIEDPNVQQILFDLSDSGIHRPTYATVNPGLDDIAMRYWQARRFVPIASTFEDFLRHLDVTIPSFSRELAALVGPSPLTIHKWITTALPATDRLRAYLTDEVTHVHPGLISTGVDPKAFYAGESQDWGAIQQNLDVPRRVAEEVILDAVLDMRRDQKCKFFLIRGHAGAGITVLLKRIAWDSAKDFDALVFFLREGGVIRPELLQEIWQLTQKPFLLVVDDSIPHQKDLQALADLARTQNIPISVLLGARTNEWNISGQDVFPALQGEIELKDLTEREIAALIVKLTHHGALGELENLSEQGREQHFRLHAGRQLLVALHEATSGKPFEEIVLDEYQRLLPTEAKVLYLDICSLHRLGVPVRAGLVSRVSGITFTYFKEKLFKPLEHVLHNYYDSASRDYVYRTRHSLIAEFVFRQALGSPFDRAAQIKRIIRHMDVDYESDRAAFGQLIRGKTLADLFADKAMAREIFDAALDSGAPESFIFHQKAVFELNHPGGNLNDALAALMRAEEIVGGQDRAIEHTKAMVLRRMALGAEHSLERERYRNEAKIILKKLQRTSRASHPFQTYAQIAIDELKDKLEGFAKRDDPVPSELEERALSELTRQAEEALSAGMQQFPADEYLLTTDAALAKLLHDEPRALDSLKRAFAENPGRSLVATRLANTFIHLGDYASARDALEKSLAENPSSKDTHFELAKLYVALGEEENQKQVAHHLKRSFTEGDTNFSAQFLFARNQFLYGDRSLAIEMFGKLADSRVPPQHKKSVQRPIVGVDGRAIRYAGYVKAKQDTYCFVSCADLHCDVFVGAREFGDEQWEKVEKGSRVRMIVGFTFKGPQGINLELLE